jgi:hypothetical protein
MKALSIIGLCVAGLSWLCLASFGNAVDYMSAIGWGYLAVWYLIALSIVALVKTNRK